MTTLQRFAQFNSGTPEIPTLRLAEPLGQDDTSLTLNNELQISDEELAKCDLLLIAVKHPSGNFENISADPSDYDSETKTISNLTRRVQADGSVVQNDSTIAKQDFPAGSRVVCVVGAQMVNQVQEVLAGERATGANDFQIGDGTATEQLFKANQGLANNSAYGFDASGNPIIYLANGSSFVPGAGAGTISGGDGIDVTASVISVDLGTNSGLEINSEKLRAKVKAGGGITRDADGLAVNESDLSLESLGEKNFGSLNIKKSLTFGEAVDGTTTPALMSLNVPTAENKRYEQALQNNNDNVFGANLFGDVFTTDSYTTHLTKISLWLYKNGNPDNLVLSLFATSGGLPTGSALETVTRSGSLAPVSYASFDFSFSSPVSVAKNTTYAWTVSLVSGTGATNYIILGKKTGFYPGGTRIYSTNSGVSWTKDTDAKMTFAVWGYNVSDGKVYRATTNDAARQYVLGFCRENVSADAVGGVQCFDIVGGFTGLTIGAKYYMQATAGTIGTSGSILVGTAISTTEIFLGR